MSLTRDQILATKVPEKDVPVPQWAGSVRLRGMDWRQRKTFLAKHTSNVDGKLVPNELFSVALIAECAIDDAGEPLFTEADIEALAEKDPDAIVLLFVEARNLSKLNPDDEIDREKKS